MTNGGGWTIFQRRSHKLVNFEMDRFAYQAGFGLVEDDYWLGLDNINILSTKDPNVELRIDIWDCQDNAFYEHYNKFSVGDVASDYILTVAGPSGTAGDAFSSSSSDISLSQNGRGFTTTAVDNDTWAFGNCADRMKGGWWFSGCGQANLNGLYIDDCHYQPLSPYGIVWGTLWNINELSAYKTVMKLRKS
uniref:Fibrinogen C-terminal domain-containing protein n=1 Tax=Plectus sambesii TaxID=2011161 RepID=A0A914WE74_9BILA